LATENVCCVARRTARTPLPKRPPTTVALLQERSNLSTVWHVVSRTHAGHLKRLAAGIHMAALRLPSAWVRRKVRRSAGGVRSFSPAFQYLPRLAPRRERAHCCRAYGAWRMRFMSHDSHVTCDMLCHSGRRRTLYTCLILALVQTREGINI